MGSVSSLPPRDDLAGAGVGSPGPSASARYRYRDRTAEAVAARRREIERALAELVTPEVVEEHRRRPMGRHSPALAWLLAYFRQAPTSGKLAVHADAPGPSRPLALLRLSGAQGVPHEELAGERYGSEEEALHAVFLRRLREHGMTAGGTAPPGGSTGDDG